MRGKDFTQHEINVGMKPIQAAVTAEARRVGVIRPNGSINAAAITYPTATARAKLVDQLSMAEWLSRHVPGVLHSDLGQWLDQTMTGWYGLNLDRLSALNWIDYLIIPSPGGDERWHVRGGNDQIIHRAVGHDPGGARPPRVGAAVHPPPPGGSYQLDFDGCAHPVIADLVILTLPFTTLRDVELRGVGLSSRKRAAIRELAMGQDAKLILQYDRRPWLMHDWSATMTSADPDFDTWESSAMEPGKAGLITVYAGGRTAAGVARPELRTRRPTAHLRDQRAEPHQRRDSRQPSTLQRPCLGRSVAPRSVDAGKLRRVRAGPVHALLGRPGQGRGRTSTSPARRRRRYSQGFLNGGVESGDRTADRDHEEAAHPRAPVTGEASLLAGLDHRRYARGRCRYASSSPARWTGSSPGPATTSAGCRRRETDEDYGYRAFMSVTAAIVMGRSTYDVAAGFDGPWRYGETPVFVVTSRPLEPAASSSVRSISAGSPAEVLAAVRARR